MPMCLTLAIELQMLLGHSESAWWFVALEVLVTAVIVIEVLIQMIAYRKVAHLLLLLRALC